MSACTVCNNEPCYCALIAEQKEAASTEPHCTHHQRFDIDCLECSDALNRQRSEAPAPSSSDMPDDTFLTVQFGQGLLAVSTGSVDDNPAVLLYETPTPGPIGGALTCKTDDLKLRLALRFPTPEQAKRVSLALVNKPDPALGVVAEIDRRLEAYRLAQPMVDQECADCRVDELKSLRAVLTGVEK